MHLHGRDLESNISTPSQAVELHILHIDKRIAVDMDKGHASYAVLVGSDSFELPEPHHLCAVVDNAEGGDGGDGR